MAIGSVHACVLAAMSRTHRANPLCLPLNPAVAAQVALRPFFGVYGAYEASRDPWSREGNGAFNREYYAKAAEVWGGVGLGVGGLQWAGHPGGGAAQGGWLTEWMGADAWGLGQLTGCTLTCQGMCGVLGGQAGLSTRHLYPYPFHLHPPPRPSGWPTPATRPTRSVLCMCGALPPGTPWGSIRSQPQCRCVWVGGRWLGGGSAVLTTDLLSCAHTYPLQPDLPLPARPLQGTYKDAEIMRTIQTHNNAMRGGRAFD